MLDSYNSTQSLNIKSSSKLVDLFRFGILSVRAYNAIKIMSGWSMDSTLFDVSEKIKAKDLLEKRNCGERTVEEIRKILNSVNLDLR